MSGERWRRIERELEVWFRDVPRAELARVSGTGDLEVMLPSDDDILDDHEMNLTDLARHLDRELPLDKAS